MSAEEEWLQSCLKNDRDRRAMLEALKPGRGHPRRRKRWPLDWIVLTVVLIFLVVGAFHQ